LSKVPKKSDAADRFRAICRVGLPDNRPPGLDRVAFHLVIQPTVFYRIRQIKQLESGATQNIMEFDGWLTETFAALLLALSGFTPLCTFRFA
jgi:hypothetical protein